MKKHIIIVSALLLMACASQKASAGPPSTLCNAGNTDCATITGSKLDVNATTSVSGFRASAYGTPITATTGAGGVAGTLPAGTEVVATNVGTTNGAYCALGATVSASTGQYIAPNGGWFGFGISADTQLTCLGVGGTTTVTMAGGSGLPTGTGGGGGSGGGGAVTQASGSVASGAYSSGSYASGSISSGAVASGAFASGSIGSGAIASGAVASGAYASGSIASGAIVDGADVTQGAKADSVCGTATGTCTITALIKYLNSQVAAMPNTGGCGSIIPISQTTSTDLHTSSGKSYICSIVLVVPDAEVVSLIEGTGTVCATGTAAVIGATTAANGMSFAANGGFSAVSAAPIFNTQTTNDHFCLLQSGSGRIAGFISYNDH